MYAPHTLQKFEEKCAQTEHRYGPVTGKFVLYRGENQEIEGIHYQNVEEYLRTIVKRQFCLRSIVKILSCPHGA